TSQTSTGIRLVSYDGCAGALTELRRAAFPLVGPYGFGGNVFAAEDSAGGSPPIGPRAGVPEQNSTSEGGAAAPAEGKAAAGPAEPAGPSHSSTNTHEIGVDEPDIAKTDGRRLVTIADGRLRIVDVAARKLVASMDIPGGTPTQLLLDGDRALVMTMNS